MRIAPSRTASWLDCRGNAPARATQLPAVPHPLCVFLSAIELLGRRIAISLESPHFARICLKFPNKLQQPHVSDAKLLSPSASRWPAGVATGPPPQRESPDHELLFLAAKRSRWMISLTLKRFSKVFHRSIVRITTRFRSVQRCHAPPLPRSCGVTSLPALTSVNSKGLRSGSGNPWQINCPDFSRYFAGTSSRAPLLPEIPGAQAALAS